MRGHQLEVNIQSQEIRTIITARKRSWGKVVFLQMSVILFTGEVPVPGGVPGRGGGGLLLGGSAPRGVPGGDPPGQLLLRAVRILLECILVLCYCSP